MIGYLVGKVFEILEGEIILMVNDNVGHIVKYSKKCKKGDILNLFISHIFRENDQILFGHDTLVHRKFFNLLLTIKGIGPKIAFNISSYIDIKNLYFSVVNGNKSIFKNIPGVGEKAASRIMIDLQSNLKKLEGIFNPLDGQRVYSDEDESKEGDDNNIQYVSESILALEELGYKKDIVYPIITKIGHQSKILNSGQLIRMVLAQLR